MLIFIFAWCLLTASSIVTSCYWRRRVEEYEEQLEALRDVCAKLEVEVIFLRNKYKNSLTMVVD